MLRKLFKRTCVDGGPHKFLPMLVEVIPPRYHSMVETTVYGMEVYLDKLSTKRYEIRCEYCGQKPQEKTS